jgi:formamidopyrimidine-DNA glycosylase
MPELPEVETTRLGLLPLVGQTVARVIIRNGSLRWPTPQSLVEMLPQHILTAISRRAKYILLHFDHGVLLMHLGMSGRICLLTQDDPPQKHDHFDLHFNGGQVLRLRDPRRFGAVLWAGQHPDSHMLLKVLGPEPLSDTFTGAYLYQSLRTRSAAIKINVMNSHLVVGVGNIYASESLFRARIHPQTPAKTLSLPDCERLVTEIKATLQEALAAGGSSLRDFFGTDGNPGYFQQAYYVYGRTGGPCKVCGIAIQSIRLGQRSAFYCKICQPIERALKQWSL